MILSEIQKRQKETNFRCQEKACSNCENMKVEKNTTFYESRCISLGSILNLSIDIHRCYEFSWKTKCDDWIERKNEE